MTIRGQNESRSGSLKIEQELPNVIPEKLFHKKRNKKANPKLNNLFIITQDKTNNSIHSFTFIII